VDPSGEVRIYDPAKSPEERKAQAEEAERLWGRMRRGLPEATEGESAGESESSSTTKSAR
jgi:hypothetical protein